MKVRFLRSGRFAHHAIIRGQFDVKEGDVVNGIVESDANMWEKAGALEIIGSDDADESEDSEVEDESEIETKNSDDPNMPDEPTGNGPPKKNGGPPGSSRV